MKNKFNLVLSAIIGSVLTLGTYSIIIDEPVKSDLTIKKMETVPVSGVVYNKTENGEYVPLDFVSAAKDVTPSVVHITSTVSVQQPQGRGQYRNLPDPFRDFFGDEFFRQYFGPGDAEGQEGQPFRRQGSGSGVIINENGYIVTNNHVIEEAEEIQVTLYDNSTHKATVIGTDPATDLALIQIEAKGLKAIPLVNSDDVQVGEWVLAVGNPFNLNSTVTAGIVSAKARNINILKDRYAIESFIQTDAAINPGNSGGALVNLQGGLVGINTAIASPTGAYAGYGFAVPSNMVNKIVEDLLQYGEVQRGYLGVTIRNINSQFANEKQLEVNNGVYVDSVVDNSAAGEAGIKAGDVIIEVDNKPIRTSPNLLESIAGHRPGDKVNVKVDRFGSERSFTVVLKNRSGDTKIVKSEVAGVLKGLGADFATLNSDEAKKLGIDGGVHVIRLYPGILKRDTDMREGFIITKADNQQVRSVDDLVRVLENKKGGILIEGFYGGDKTPKFYGIGLNSNS